MTGPPLEIERKFLVSDDAWRPGEPGTRMQQGYLCRGETTVRIRVAGDAAWLTIKGATSGLTRVEREYPMPVGEATALLEHNAIGSLIDKTRYRVRHGSHVWEVDEFHGDHAGLVVAEVELESEDEAVDLPAWVGEEVSYDSRYRNASLAIDGAPEA